MCRDHQGNSFRCFQMDPIEHRLLNSIKTHWTGQLVDSYETTLNPIRPATSAPGFGPQAELEITNDETKRSLTRFDLAAVVTAPTIPSMELPHLLANTGNLLL